MTQDVFSEIAALLRAEMPIIGQIKAYAFGSAVYNAAAANDVDLLVIYENADQPDLVRAVLSPVDLKMPLHLTFMLEEEEQETAFISSQKCILLDLIGKA